MADECACGGTYIEETRDTGEGKPEVVMACNQCRKLQSSGKAKTKAAPSGKGIDTR